MAAAAVTKEALWLAKLLPELGVEVNSRTIKIYCDNQGAIKLLRNPIIHQRSKHIDIMHHFVRERVTSKEVDFEYCSTDEQLADCFTKPLAGQKLLKARIGMGLTECENEEKN